VIKDLTINMLFYTELSILKTFVRFWIAYV